MGTQISFISDRLRNSYWFTPTLMMVGAAILAWITTSVDEEFDPENVPWIGGLIFSGGPDGAREVLGTIAASMITVAGVVFSITIVSLQLASTQFGPRMLANFMRDRGNQLTLGTFVSTFLYSLLALRTIRTADPGAVPHLSVTTAVVLAIVSLSVLIYFIHHISTSIQAPNLIKAIATELGRATDHLFPDVDENDKASAADAPRMLPEDFDRLARTIEAPGTGYVQMIDVGRLVEIGREHDLVVRLDVRPGRFVVEGTGFASAYPAARVTDEVAGAIAESAVTGARRTTQHDIEFPIRQLVEIGVRALSPSMNDPFTASTCVDQISGGLCVLAARALPSPYLLDEDGSLRVAIDDPVTWERLVAGAYDQIRQSADFHTSVYVHLLEALTRIARCVRDRSRLAPVVNQARLTLDAALAHVEAEADQLVVRQRYDTLMAVVDALQTA